MSTQYPGSEVSIPGSLDSDAIDAEHTLPPYKCEADEHYATKEDVQDIYTLLDENMNLTTQIVQRLRVLEHADTGPGPATGYIAIDSVPWDSISHALAIAIYGAPRDRNRLQAALDWFHKSAPKEYTK